MRRNIVFKHFPTHLNRDLIIQFPIMIKQWSKIDPNPSIFQRPQDRVYIIKDVVGSIQEEASCNPLEVFRPLVINLSKLSSHYSEIELLLRNVSQLLSWRNVRDKYTTEDVCFVVVVLRRVNKRINFELLFLLSTVDNEVGTEEHEVGQFVPLGSETCLHQLENQSAEAAARNQHNISGFQIFLALFDQFEVVFLFHTFGTPLSKKLLDRGLDFGSVVGRSSCLGMKMGLLNLVDVVQDSIKKELVALECLEKHGCLALAVDGVVAVELVWLEEGGVLALEVLGVVGEGCLYLDLVLLFMFALDILLILLGVVVGWILVIVHAFE